MASPQAQFRSSRTVLATRRAVTSAGKETGPFASSTNQRKSWDDIIGSAAGGGGVGGGSVAPVAWPSLVEARRPEGGRPALPAAAAAVEAPAPAPGQLLARPARGRGAGACRCQQQRRPAPCGCRQRHHALQPSLLEPRISSAATWRIANVAWQMAVARAPAHCSEVPRLLLLGVAPGAHFTLHCCLLLKLPVALPFPFLF